MNGCCWEKRRCATRVAWGNTARPTMLGLQRAEATVHAPFVVRGLKTSLWYVKAVAITEFLCGSGKEIIGLSWQRFNA